MSLSIRLNDTVYPLGYHFYAFFVEHLEDIDDTYADLIDHMVRFGDEDVWRQAAAKRHMKDETFLLMYEHGSLEILETLLHSRMANKLLTKDLLRAKWHMLTPCSMQGIIKRQTSYSKIAPCDVQEMIYATGRLDVLLSLAKSRWTVRYTLEQLANHPDVDIADAAQRTLAGKNRSQLRNRKRASDMLTQ